MYFGSRLLLLLLICPFYIKANIYTPFETKGATECEYFILMKNDKKYFVKTGEKVDKEIQNMTFLRDHAVECIPLMMPDSSIEQKTLITEFMSGSKYGFEMIEDLYSGSITHDAFLRFQFQAIQLLEQFYSIPIDSGNKNSIRVFGGRVQQRIKDLLNDQDTISVQSDNGEITLRSILNSPITYHCKNGTYQFSNLLKIVDDFLELNDQLPQTGHFVLHGDFHAPNLCKDAEKLVLVDLSDVMYGEDPAWELGKWLNHLSRLHKVVSIRHNDKPDPLISFSFDGTHLELYDQSEDYCKLEDIRRKAVEQFAGMIRVDKELMNVKTAAAEFIVNISTLRRHMIKFPDSTRGILTCIIKSYLNLKSRFSPDIAHICCDH